ncbi:uncharacterized protein (TIGR03086 family) [Nocardioides ginsengisegetis]|uniref:Uncharacterized protein (TIGR03086 family) n=1 Tax=Nocardioides ginsengisegetis TaxID=661491 RepID=A0A7W3P8H5_9ACTN|nr:TIGR03086 family metal-binding protein [Nocardioides ginsengisegetis]MBA8802437.1 uncharacterized protein (TIGR03086 family) [Nocardioides ginsengisegetis]
MTMPNDAVVTLSHALDQAGDVLASVRHDQLGQPTPCADWDVGQLVAHLVAGPRRFAETMRGGEADWSAPAPPVEQEWASEFRSAADDLIHLWHQEGDRAQARIVDWQTTEFAVHTWDLARAVGYRWRLDDRVAETALAFMRAGMTADNRGTAFAPEVAVDDRATAYERLAAFAGRSPTKTSDVMRSGLGAAPTA